MSTPNEPQDNNVNQPVEGDATASPADANPTEPIAAAPTEPIAPVAPAVPAATVAATPAASTPAVTEVKKKWLWVGAGVGAFACLGLAFGLGYITGDQTGGHGERGNHHRMDRGENGKMHRGNMQRGDNQNGEEGQNFGRGQWRMGPPELRIVPQNPGQQQTPGQQTPGQQTPGQQAPTTTTPGASS